MRKTNSILLITVVVLCTLGNALYGEDMQSGLTQRQKNIVGIAANTATTNLELLKQELNAALDAGMTVNEAKEILVHVYAYVGFPRSLLGLRALTAALAERQGRGIKDNQRRDASPVTDTGSKYERGKRNLERLLRGPLPPESGKPEIIDVFLREHLFADIFERDILTFVERELATISALTAMDGVDPMRLGHIQIGMNLGLTEAQIQELTAIINASKPTIF